MGDLLIKIFIKNDSNKRYQYGRLSSYVGLILNVILFIFKIIIGILSNSISIISDGFNNLSDTATSFITLFGYRYVSKPADKEHPFGHGRAEYILSFTIAMIIFVLGYQLFINSIKKIIKPEPLIFNYFILIVLIISILIKVWLSLFNRKIGKAINSTMFIAISKDARNDVIATSATAISLVLSKYISFPIDGVMGLIVSIIIITSGYQIVKETVDNLLGKIPDETTIELIDNIIKHEKRIFGFHDLMIHNYGPDLSFASCHVEVSDNEQLVEIHDVIDKLERKILNETGILITMHVDPLSIDDKLSKKLYETVKNIIIGIDERLAISELKFYDKILVFDLIIPFDFNDSKKVISTIKNKLKSEEILEININVKNPYH